MTVCRHTSNWLKYTLNSGLGTKLNTTNVSIHLIQLLVAALMVIQEENTRRTRILNPLTMSDDYSHHRNSAACYQLVQSVLKIGSALAERVGQGEVGGTGRDGWVHRSG